VRTLIATDVKEGKGFNPEKLKVARNLGLQLIEYYNQIIHELESDNDAEKNAQYYRSLINSKFNIAKTLSKLYTFDTKERVEFLKRSLYKYKEVAEFINKHAQPKEEFAKELELTN
jgi:rRNA maturation protein Rpf1